MLCRHTSAHCRSLSARSRFQFLELILACADLPISKGNVYFLIALDLYTGGGFHFLKQPALLLFLPFAPSSLFFRSVTPFG